MLRYSTTLWQIYIRYVLLSLCPCWALAHDTITGVGQILKLRKPNLRVVAVESTGGAVLSRKPSGPHKIQEMGGGFVPDIIDRSSTRSSRTEISPHSILRVNSPI